MAIRKMGGEEMGKSTKCIVNRELRMMVARWSARRVWRTRLGSTASAESRQVHAWTGDARSLFAKASGILLPEAAMHS